MGPEGTLTTNAQITGRLLVMDWIGILLLAGYLECGLGFAETNHDFITEFEFITRGGSSPFLLGLSASLGKQTLPVVESFA